MDIELRFFATFREAVGEKTITREIEGGTTVDDLLYALEEEYPDLDIHTAEGDLREYLSILKNGRDISFLDGPETTLEPGDTLSIFPPVAGGCEDVVERSFRGISERAAMHYLERIGGESITEQSVAGEDWEAVVSSEKVEIGPSLQLTEVSVRFEGDCATLDTVIEAFAKKAVRAGG